MSDFGTKALNANFQSWKQERMSQEEDSTAFELYAIGTILKDQDLSDDDIDFGHIGGADDGGVDGIYLFVDGTLVRDDDHHLPRKTQVIDLVLVQVKRSGGFSENVVDQIGSFIRDVLEWDVPVDNLLHLNTQARESIALFRTIYDKIIGHVPSLQISLYYITGSECRTNPKVTVKVDGIQRYLASKISHANLVPEFWDCTRLLEAVRTPPKQNFRVPTVKMFATDDEAAAVCLVRVTDMAEFLGDGTGGQRKTLLESNIRAYQGNVQVNKDIRKTLRSGTQASEFWWFNNGVTVLADSCHISGRNLVMERPQIVNGLQTCHEMFEYVTSVQPSDDQRSVLLRAIVPPDPATRNSIIKATNFQTSITPVSLKAMDTLHFNIEDRLRLYDLYYERRKGEYRVKRKPRASIVSIHDVGKAVIAIVLQRPDTARARPGTLLNSADRYEDVFPDGSDTETYATCTRIDRRIHTYLLRESQLNRNVRADVRYYVCLLASCVLAKAAEPTREEIGLLGQRIATGLSNDVIAECVKDVVMLYDDLGGTDKVAKGPDLLREVKTVIRRKYGSS